jgi:lysophospholipase L1-like esterase
MTKFMGRFGILLPLVLVFSACGTAGSRGKTETSYEAKLKIVMFGDSITEYVTNWYPGGWSELLKAAGVINKGIAGNTTAQMLARIDSVYKEAPDICFFMGGINDLLWTNATVSEIAARIQEIIEALKGRGIEVVVSSTLHVSAAWDSGGRNLKVDQINDLIWEYCQNNGITFLELNGILSPGGYPEPANTKDGLHLTKAAYEKWSELIIPVLERMNQ